MERRDLLKLIATTTGMALVGGEALAYDLIAPVPLSATGFSKEDVALLNEMAEVIIPQTDTPGAKAANVGQIIAVLVADCYTPQQQKIFNDGIATIKLRSQREFREDFLLLTSEQKTNFFNTLNNEAEVYNREESPEKAQPHYFTLLKQLTLFGFFTSEKGATEALRYVATPGRYDGEIAYNKGDKAWAT